MAGNGQPAVTPPMGGRRPLGGAESQDLQVGGVLPQQQYAPVPPAQPQTGVTPPWAQPAQPVPVTFAVDQKLPPERQAMAVDGIRAGAPVAEIIPYFPGLDLNDLRVLAQRHGLVLNEGQPSMPPPPPVQAQQDAYVNGIMTKVPEQLPPIAAAMAPAAQASASQPMQLPPPPTKPVQRVTKKTHWPIIEAMLRNDRNVTAETVAYQIGAPIENTRKAMKEVLALIDAGQSVAQASEQPEVEATGALASTAPVATAQAVEDRQTVADTGETRTLMLLRGVKELARAGGFTYIEVEAMAALLSVSSQ